MLSKYITSAVIFTLSVFLQHQITDAFCPGNFRGEGDITFYWKENAEDRKGQARNWGKSEETFDGNTYAKLPVDVDPKYIYAYQITGDCCWRIYNKTNFGGPSEDLENLDFQVFGFRGIPKFPLFNVNSLKKVPCPSSK